MVQTTGANFEFPRIPDFLLPKKAEAAKSEGPVDKADIGGSNRRSADIKNADPNFFGVKPEATRTRETSLTEALAEVKEAPSCPPGECVDKATLAAFEERTKQELGPLAHGQNLWDIQEIKGRVPDLAEVQAVFNQCAEDKSIPWEHIIDGCYARAHTAAEKFLDAGINCGKFYGIIGDNHPGWRFHTSNKFCEGNWWYHVAAIVFAKDDKGQVDGYIIDPAVNPKTPIKAHDWIKAYWNEQFPIKFDTTQADIYEPQEETPTGDAQPFSKEKFDSMVAESHQINAEYSKALHDIKDAYYQQHPDEKPPGWQ